MVALVHVMCCFSLLQYGKTALEFAKAFAREVMLPYYVIFVRHWVIVHPRHGIERRLASSFTHHCKHSCYLFHVHTHTHTHTLLLSLLSYLPYT